jgi:predicted adenylyl cyclase CyaB
MLNFEIKTKISDPDGFIKRVQSIGAVYKETMSQKDYYFEVGMNKEKVREINNQEPCLISYKRLEKKGRKDSNYNIRTLSLEEKNLLFKQKHLLCTVDKTRQLWMYKNTRIHLDNVVGLGNFMELETVVKDISINEGSNEFEDVVNKLKIKKEKAEPYSYSDLILASKI